MRAARAALSQLTDEAKEDLSWQFLRALGWPERTTNRSGDEISLSPVEPILAALEHLIPLAASKAKAVPKNAQLRKAAQFAVAQRIADCWLLANGGKISTGYSTGRPTKPWSQAACIMFNIHGDATGEEAVLKKVVKSYKFNDSARQKAILKIRKSLKLNR